MSDPGWHVLADDETDLPDCGERVIICVADAFVGEGYLKKDGEWYRYYCDTAPLKKYMRRDVTKWMPMPKP